ncbi:MAG: hypothetical protein WA532_01495 [Candidatus Korobacteraceae bacterium]
MKKFFAALMFLCAIPALAATTLTGTVTDDMCGANHMMPGKSPAECTRGCVKHGAHFALAVKDKVYILDGKTAEVDKLAGSKATVQGTLNGNVLTVSSIAAK